VELEGKVAIVTGGGQGIGRGIALYLAQAGASIVVTGRTVSTLEETVLQIEAAGGRAIAIPTDVTKSEEITAMVKSTIKKFGKVDILVNNAAFMCGCPLIDLSEDNWDKIFDTNLKGVFLCCQAVGKEMIKNRYGKIVNISSGGAHLPIPNDGAYCASKAGLVLLTQALAIEWGKYNINVNAVSPGLTESPAVARARIEVPAVMELRAKRIPMQRVATPEDVAKAVMFLVTSASDNITGDVIRVDGGTTIIHPGFV